MIINYRIIKAVLIIILLGWLCYGLLMGYLTNSLNFNNNFAVAFVTILFAVLTYLGIKMRVL